MRHHVVVLQCLVLAIMFHAPRVLLADGPGSDTSKWHIKDIYNYLSEAGEDLFDKEIREYCQFIIDSQDPKRGTFADEFDEYIYSVKAYYLLKRFGYEPKYRMAVRQQVGKDLHYGRVSDDSDVIVTDTIDPKLFKQWLDRVRTTYDAYDAGSLMGHFIHPHAMNIERDGKKLEDSPYIQVFHDWILENQGQNGFWNRPDDTDFNGWNGAMKMDSSLKIAGFNELPNASRMLKTILKYQNPEEGSFTAAGGCTNHNALHTLRQCSKRNNLVMWPEVFLAMERHMSYLERRWDPVTGLFRTPPGFDGPLDEFSTKIADSEAGNVVDYCTVLLRPENAQRIASTPSDGITPDRIRRLLVQATGLGALSRSKSKELAKARHEEKYGKEGSGAR